MASDFKLEILSQRWLGPYEDPQADACSHGGIRAEIAGTIVTSDEAEYGISQSALWLLRTLEQDHSGTHRASKRFLLCHGCGYPLPGGCDNFGTDWFVRRQGNGVLLSDPSLIDGRRRVTFDVYAQIPIADYRRKIVEFAQEARDFYVASGPRTVEAWEMDFHDRFWAEFDERLQRAKRALQHADVNHRDISGSTSPYEVDPLWWTI